MFGCQYRCLDVISYETDESCLDIMELRLIDRVIYKEIDAYFIYPKGNFSIIEALCMCLLYDICLSLNN